MRNKLLLSLVLCCLGWSLSAQTKSSIEGRWRVLNADCGIFPGYYNVLKSESEILFKNGSVKIGSGIYYYIDDPYIEDPQTQSNARGRFPFVLYGKVAKYVASKNLLKFFYEPLKTWSTFKFSCQGKDTLFLEGEQKSITLIRKKHECKRAMIQADSIESITARVENLEMFLVSYSVALYPNDSIVYKDDKYPDGISYKLSKGYFLSVVDEMRCLSLEDLESEYLAEESDETETTLMIKTQGGRSFETMIYGDYAPPELKSALVSIIYAYQKYAFGKIKPLRIDSY